MGTPLEAEHGHRTQGRSRAGHDPLHQEQDAICVKGKPQIGLTGIIMTETSTGRSDSRLTMPVTSSWGR